MSSAGRAPRVALIGADGHGRWHRRNLARLQAAGAATLVAVCDVAAIQDEPDAPVPRGARIFDDYRVLLAESSPDVAVICTPPHTHLEIATAAARAGADLLLEKPPVTSRAEHAALARVLDETGRMCQVGFQALGSAALAELTTGIADGELGPVTGISAAGAWQRPDAYYRRAPWAGRRTVAGRPVLDGALVNPFAHALMQCLAVAEVATGGPPMTVELAVERYHARPIEVDDTAVLRLRLDGRLPVVVAATLCADERIDGEVTVHTPAGAAVLEYATDRLRLPGSPAAREVPGRRDLLADLLSHRAGSPSPLLADLSRTRAFTAVAETMVHAGDPHPVPVAAQRVEQSAGERTVTVPGVSRMLREAAARLALPSELGVDWARPPFRGTIQISEEGGG